MSSTYFFKLDKSKDKNKDFLNSFYLSGSYGSYSDILLSRLSKITGSDYEEYQIITSNKFNSIEDEIKRRINNFYQSFSKELGILFMAKLDGLNQENFDKLQKYFITKLLPKFKKDLNIILDEIIKIEDNKEKLHFNIVLLNSLLTELNSEEILDNGESLYKEYSIYEEYITNNPELKEKIDKSIEEYISNKRKNFVKLVTQIEFLQDIFLKYPNTYTDKEYILENLLYHYDEIINLLRLFLFIRIGNITKTDIIYG